MKIVTPEGSEIDALTGIEFDQKYFSHAIQCSRQEVHCICSWYGLRGELIRERDIEQMHPANRRNPHCNMQDQRGCHWTAFESCPKCQRCIFADGQRIN